MKSVDLIVCLFLTMMMMVMAVVAEADHEGGWALMFTGSAVIALTIGILRVRSKEE